MKLKIAVGALLLGAGLGCASSGASEQSGPATRWTGNFQGTQQLSGNVSPMGRARATGTVSMVPGRSDAYSHFTIQATLPFGSMPVPWALMPGRCGAPTLPVLAIDQFPLLEISSNGRGQLSIELPVNFPESGTYHVAIFRSGGGTDASDLLACADLRAG